LLLGNQMGNDEGFDHVKVLQERLVDHRPLNQTENAGKDFTENEHDS
jgi:hypothetical protein